MKKTKTKEILSVDLSTWNESIKSKIESVTLDSVTLDVFKEGVEELYFTVCFKESNEFKGEVNLRKKIERLLKTNKVIYFYNLPF